MTAGQREDFLSAPLRTRNSSIALRISQERLRSSSAATLSRAASISELSRNEIYRDFFPGGAIYPHMIAGAISYGNIS